MPYIVTALTPAAHKLPHREHEPERKRVPKPPPKPPKPARFCGVDDCTREYHSKGMCRMHYQRATIPRKTARRKGKYTYCFCGKPAAGHHLCQRHYDIDRTSWP